MNPARVSSQARYLWPVAVAAAAILVYWNTLQNGFVWDDHIYIEHNRALQGAVRWALLLDPAFYKSLGGNLGASRPVFIFSLILDKLLWGLSPSGFHWTNLILHAANSLLIYRLALAFLSPWAAGSAALLFAVHPVHAEAVDAISFRTDLLATFFALLALWSFWTISKKTARRRQGLYLSLSALSYALGLLSKEMAITLPALLLWGELCLFRGRRDKRLVVEALILQGVVAVAYLAFRYPRTGYAIINKAEPAFVERLVASLFPPRTAARPGPTPQKPVYEPSKPQWNVLYHDRRINFYTMSATFAQYFRLLIAPWPLQADRPPPLVRRASDPKVILSLVFLAATLGAIVLSLSLGAGAPAFCLGWIWIALSPVSNVIPIYNPMAERYLYFVSAGGCWALAWAIEAANHGRSERSWATPRAFLLAILVGSYAMLTWTRNRDWHSDASLWSHIYYDNARIRYNLGLIAQRQGDLGRAVRQYHKATELDPLYVEALVNEAGLEKELGHWDAARKHYEAAVALKPDVAIPYVNLGIMRDEEGRRAEAEKLFRQALDIDPTFTEGRMQLAHCLESQGRVQQGLNQIEDVILRRPDYAPAYIEAARLYAKTGRYNKAIESIRKTISLGVRDPSLLKDLGLLYSKAGNSAEAQRWLKAAEGR
jgi:tetratricopeptide (TPR) repeat protein